MNETAGRAQTQGANLKGIKPLAPLQQAHIGHDRQTDSESRIPCSSDPLPAFRPGETKGSASGRIIATTPERPPQRAQAGQLGLGSRLRLSERGSPTGSGVLRRPSGAIPVFDGQVISRPAGPA